MVKFLPGDISAAEMVNIASFNSAIRIARNPFGRDAGASFYGGRAVPWKLFRKSDDESREDYLERLKDVNPGVSKGLKSAIKMGEEYSQKGTCVVQYADGGLGAMPVRSAKLGIAGKGKKVRSIIATVPLKRAQQMVRQSLMATV